MIRFFLPYYITIFKMNLIFSVFLTILSCVFFLSMPMPLQESLLYIIIFIFTLCLMTGGFILSAFYYNYSRKNEYYFYHNLGISKINLIIGAYLLNFLIALPVLIILKYVLPAGS